MGTMALAGYGDHLKKGVFPKNELFKSYGVVYILRQRQRPGSIAYLRRRSLLRTLKRLTKCSVLLGVGVNN